MSNKATPLISLEEIEKNLTKEELVQIGYTKDGPLSLLEYINVVNGYLKIQINKE